MSDIKKLMEAIDKLTLKEGRYWENAGEHEKEAQELMKLVEPSGPSKTLKGELMRAASKIYYDYYNNGFGNTWQEPAQFLMNHIQFSDAVKEMFYEHGGGVTEGGGLDNVLEAMMSTVIENIYEMDDRPNTSDMWDTPFDKNSFPEEEYDDDEYDDDDNYDDFSNLAG